MSRSAKERERERPLHDIVLGAVQPSSRRVAVQAIVVAAVLHMGGAALAVTMGRAPDAAKKSESKPLVMFEHVVELDPPPPPPPVAPPPEVPPPAPKAAPKQKAVEPPVRPAAQAEPPPVAAPEPPAAEPPPVPSEPPPAAQAAQVVAAAATSEQAPSFAVATGSGQAYAGGTTSGSGTAQTANHTGQVGVGNGQGLGRARGAQLRTRNPPCGWPSEAEDSDLEEAFVTVRATVQADGAVSAVEVVTDPGYGFGKRSQWCLKSKMRFEPALDDAGRPIASVTPPIRVRFVREE